MTFKDHCQRHKTAPLPYGRGHNKSHSTFYWWS